MFRVHNKAGFNIAFIHCDNEFKAVFEDIKDDIQAVVNYASAKEHVPEAERNNRVIKERIRATLHRLPYRRLPTVLLCELPEVMTRAHG